MLRERGWLGVEPPFPWVLIGLYMLPVAAVSGVVTFCVLKGN
jgi:hypothetical protein